MEREINLEEGEETLQLSSPEKRLLPEFRLRPHPEFSLRPRHERVKVDGGEILKQEKMDTEGNLPVERKINLERGEEVVELSSSEAPSETHHPYLEIDSTP